MLSTIEADTYARITSPLGMNGFCNANLADWEGIPYFQRPALSKTKVHQMFDELAL